VSFFRGRGDVFEPSELTRGPWDPDSQHAGPPAALLGRAIERCGEAEGKHVGRVTFEVLRPVPISTLTVSARVGRPGRSVELVEASLADDEGEVMRATAWRLKTESVELEPAPPDEPPPHGPADGMPRDFFPTGVDVGYHTAMEYRFVTGAFLELGPAVVWMRMRHPLVEGEEPSPLQRVLVAADSGNGVSAALDYHRYLFINTDLTVHLHRGPETEWVCLDAVTRLDSAGVGMSDTELWDERGRVGRAGQTLLVRERV
jgi:acyl-Coa thioesterase superfamily protein/acyl-CoA thioesterase superfamily protein